jgi:hypothetical protein
VRIYFAFKHTAHLYLGNGTKAIFYGLEKLLALYRVKKLPTFTCRLRFDDDTDTGRSRIFSSEEQSSLDAVWIVISHHSFGPCAMNIHLPKVLVDASDLVAQVYEYI